MKVEGLQYQFPEVIDSTMRNDYVSCGLQFMYSRIFGLSPKGGSVHLIAGGAFAKGIETVRREVYKNNTEVSEAIFLGVAEALKHYGSFEPGDKYETKSAFRVACAIPEYFAEYDPYTDAIQPYFTGSGEPAIEFQFAFPLETKHPETGNPLLFGGRFDMAGVYMSDLWVVDEKTASRLGPQWTRSFTLRGQFLAYCYAAQHYGLPVNGFIVRGLSFLKDYYGHEQVIEVVPKYRIEQWREQVEIDAANMVRDYENERFSFAFGEACNAYGGCAFRNLCGMEKWQDWWNSYYEVSYWNPLEGNVPKNLDHDKPILEGFSS